MSNVRSIKSRWAQWSSILLVIVGLGFGITMLPSGYSEDLSVIGNGSDVVVLVHNKESARSVIQMDQIGAIREQYKGRVEFRIADVGTPNGAAFANQHGADESMLVLFNGSGKHLKSMLGPNSTVALAQSLDLYFNF